MNLVIRKAAFIGVGIMVLAGCESVEMTRETVDDMPSGFLCEALGPNWITTVEERIVIHSELERRNVECIDSSRIVVEQR